MRNFQDSSTAAYWAAVYEAEQAARDFGEAYRAFVASGARAGSPADYAVWSTSAYAEACDRLVRTMPVWEA